MKIRCLPCGEYFSLHDETLELIADGYISSATTNTYDECFGMISNPPVDALDMYSDADPGL